MITQGHILTNLKFNPKQFTTFTLTCLGFVQKIKLLRESRVELKGKDGHQKSQRER